MKTNKIIAAGLSASAIVFLSVGSVSAMGNGQGGQNKGMSQYITAEERAELKNMSEEDRKAYIQQVKEKNNIAAKGNCKADHNPTDMIANIPASDLSDKEEEILIYAYNEQIVARDAYNYLYELYGEDVFKKISDSEQKHMDAVKVLLDRYNLDVPVGYGDLQSTFDRLKSEGEQGLKEALEVGLQIETLDIKDIEDAISNTNNDDIKVVFTNVGGASYNHMKAFADALITNNFNTDINYSEFLSEDDLASKGPLKYKLAESLEAKGVELPEQVSSETLKSKIPNTLNTNSQKNSNKVNFNKYENNSVLKAKYKSTYEVKYGLVISKMNNSQLEIFIDKINNILEKVEKGNYSYDIKNKYNAMLLALKEIAVDNIDEDNILEGLFN